MDGFEWMGETNATTRAWFVHGILGQGRNWRSFAQRWRAASPDDRAAGLVDLRNHGHHPPASPPHDLQACAQDLQTRIERQGPPTLLVGHSFGGKVVLQWLRDHAPADPPIVWVLDSPPGPTTLDGDDPTSAPRVLRRLRSAPTPADSRDAVRAHLRADGLPDPIVAWLLTSLQRSDDGQWRWLYDLDGVGAMLDSYAATDLWPVLREHPRAIRLVGAGRRGRLGDADVERARTIEGLGVHVLTDASHWLQVDDPQGLLALIEQG